VSTIVLHDLRLLRPFLTLADELHFTRAAARLHIAQPALSQQIARLEQQVGAPLFVRSPHGVTLTEAGRALLARVGPALQTIDEGVEVARRVAAGTGGVLRVEFVSSLAARAVPLIAAAFRDQMPGVELQLNEGSMLEQLTDLRARRIDLALFVLSRHVDLDDRDLVVDVLATGPHYGVLPASHGKANAHELDLSELARETFVMPSGSDEGMPRPRRGSGSFRRNVVGVASPRNESGTLGRQVADCCSAGTSGRDGYSDLAESSRLR
jgi:DNA-binding transcriptional LysR family regulator